MNSLTSILIVAVIAITFLSMPSIIHAKQSGLTIVLKLHYSKVIDKHPELYDHVKLDIGIVKYHKVYDLSDKPSKITVKGLKISEGQSFEVHLNNPKTDEGEQIKMTNTKCTCKEVGTIRVP